MAIKTPPALPETGRVFVITLPDSEPFFAVFAGALVSLVRDWYWVQSDGGLTPEETVEAFELAFVNLRFDLGVPDE